MLLSEYATFQLSASKNHLVSVTSGPNSTRTAVSCGGTLLRKVNKVGRDSVDSKPDFDGDESVDELVSGFLSSAINGDEPDAEEKGMSLRMGSTGSWQTTLRRFAYM